MHNSCMRRYSVCRDSAVQRAMLASRERDAHHTTPTCRSVASVHRPSHALLVTTVQKNYNIICIIPRYTITNVQQAKRSSSANKNTYDVPGIRLSSLGDNYEDPLIVEVITRNFYERLFSRNNESYFRSH